MGNNQMEAMIGKIPQSSAQKAAFQKKQFDKNLSYMSFLFANQVCWWFRSKDIKLQKLLIKKLCQQNLLFLKLFKCKLALGTICYQIVIDGYVQDKGQKIIPAIQQALKLFQPIVLIQGFKIQQILVFNPYGSFDYTFDEADIQCMICLDVKSLGNKQGCCGKPACENCRKSQVDRCFYCKQLLLLRDYLNKEQYATCKKIIKEKQDNIRQNGVQF